MESRYSEKGESREDSGGSKGETERGEWGEENGVMRGKLRSDQILKRNRRLF